MHDAFNKYSKGFLALILLYRAKLRLPVGLMRFSSLIPKVEAKSKVLSDFSLKAVHLSPSTYEQPAAYCASVNLFCTLMN